MTLFSNISLETWSHIVGVIGFIMMLISVIIAWRKKIFKSGFMGFQDVYRADMAIYDAKMNDFKTEIRNYINKSDERHTRTLDRIAELYEQTHNDINRQIRVCDVIQATKEGADQANEVWKKSMDVNLQKLEKRIIHIENCVNNASGKTRRRG
jgi:phage-related protein